MLGLTVVIRLEYLRFGRLDVLGGGVQVFTCRSMLGWPILVKVMWTRTRLRLGVGSGWWVGARILGLLGLATLTMLTLGGRFSSTVLLSTCGFPVCVNGLGCGMGWVRGLSWLLDWLVLLCLVVRVFVFLVP